MSDQDLSQSAEPSANTQTTPSDDTAAEETKTQSGDKPEDTGNKPEKGDSPKPEQKAEETLSESEILAELGDSKPPVDTAKQDSDRAARKVEHQLNTLSASKRVQKAIDDGTDQEDAIKAEKTNLQGSLRKLFNGEDLEPQREDHDALARKAQVKAEDESNFKKEFAKLVKDHGINTATTTSVEKRKELKALAERLQSDKVSKTEAVGFAASKLFGKAPATKKGGAAANKVEPTKAGSKSNYTWAEVESMSQADHNKTMNAYDAGKITIEGKKRV